MRNSITFFKQLFTNVGCTYICQEIHIAKSENCSIHFQKWMKILISISVNFVNFLTDDNDNKSGQYLLLYLFLQVIG